jgi:hypothetical protein
VICSWQSFCFCEKKKRKFDQVSCNSGIRILGWEFLLLISAIIPGHVELRKITLQGCSPNATPHNCNTTDLVAIREPYCNLSIKWLQYGPIMQWTKCVAICRCNRRVLLQPFKNFVTISWCYCHGALELH